MPGKELKIDKYGRTRQDHLQVYYCPLGSGNEELMVGHTGGGCRLISPINYQTNRVHQRPGRVPNLPVNLGTCCCHTKIPLLRLISGFSYTLDRLVQQYLSFYPVVCCMREQERDST